MGAQLTANAIRKDVLESDLLSCLNHLKKHTEGRAAGKRQAPESEEDADSKKAKPDEDEWWQRKGKFKDRDKKNWWDDAAERSAAGACWDDEDSDPDEDCPDVLKHGSCSYGRQCGFCFRNGPLPG